MGNYFSQDVEIGDIEASRGVFVVVLFIAILGIVAGSMSLMRRGFPGSNTTVTNVF